MKPTKLNLKLVHSLAMVMLGLSGSEALTCAAETALHGEQAQERMGSARDEVANVRSNIFLTLVELDRVRGERDPQRPQFRVFTNQLARMEALVKAFGRHAEEMKQKGTLYFSDWETRTAAIEKPEDRKRAEEGYVERKDSYDDIIKFMQTARENFILFVTEINRIKTILEGNPNQEGIAMAKELFSRANWHCIDVQRALMNIERKFDDLAASFAKDR